MTADYRIDQRAFFGNFLINFVARMSQCDDDVDAILFQNFRFFTANTHRSKFMQLLFISNRMHSPQFYLLDADNFIFEFQIVRHCYQFCLWRQVTDDANFVSFHIKHNGFLESTRMKQWMIG